MQLRTLLSHAALGALALATPAYAQAVQTVDVATADAREAITLAKGWRFRQDDALKGAEDLGFDDQSWDVVSVPHSWNRVGYYLPKSADRVNRPDTVNKTMGVGWYRLAFTPPPAFAGKRAWLEFDAASRIASVWLNGVFLGEHRGGYSRFRLDATAALRLGERNVLVVKADNSKPTAGSVTADVLPLTGDFFVPGGLYRPVRLVATDPVHFDMLDAGGPGVYAQTAAINDGTARVNVVAKLRNDSARVSALRVRARLIDKDSRIAASQEAPASVRPGTATDLPLVLSVPQPHLWHGVTDPYLYRLSVEILSGGRVVDRIEQAFGIRQMAFDPRRGFLLNGKPYKLHGVGYHQDREDKGWAIAPDDVAGDMAIFRELGATAIRLTHYQHGQPIHDLADRYGLILWDEIPLVSAWTLSGAKEASPALRANARQQLTELIRQNQNHPSVAVWSIANEVDFGNSLPAFLTGFTGTPPDPLPLLRELGGVAKAMDASRPTTLATCCEGRVFAPGIEVPITAPAADLGGTNRYYGWYYGQPEDLSEGLDALRTARPDQPLAITEYGAGGATSIHTDNVLGGPIDSRGRLQPEEIESDVHERNWAVLSQRSDLWATWLWSGFDFASIARHEGDAEDINTKGLVTFDRKIRKDAFYFYKANWASEPTVHVNGRRYVDRAYPVTEVRVYSNAPRTELTLNGTVLGTLADCPQHVCVWRDVRLAQGENVVSARGLFASGPVKDRVAWRLSVDTAAAIRIDSGALVAAPSSGKRFGSDNFFVGGTAGTVVTPADFGKPAQEPVIAGTPDKLIAATYRAGTFGYRVPLPDGRYAVTLSFVEPTKAAGERVFDVLAGDRVMLAKVDVAKAAGAPMTLVQRSFAVQVRDGMLGLFFRPTRGEAIVSAVEILRTGN